MTAKLLLLCHGPTSATRLAAFPDDESLEPAAAPALAQLAPRLPRADRVIMAPGRRTAETAAVLNLTATIDDGLRDLDAGLWRGRKLADVAEQDPAAMAAWLTDPAVAPPGGESTAQLVARVAAWFAAAPISGRTLAIAHPAILRAAIIHVLAAPLASFWRIDAGPLSLVEFTHDGRRWALRLGQKAGN